MNVKVRRVAKRINRQLSFFLDEFGETVLMGGEEKIALVRDVQDKMHYYDDKIIRTPFPIQTGDLVVYQNNKWLVISEVDRDKKSYRARIRKVNYHINFVLNGDLYTFPIIIEGFSAGLDEGRSIVLQDGKILVTMPVDENVKLINVDKRFITMGKAWKVVGLDRTRRGLIILHCDLTQFSNYDDRENEIANTDQLASYGIQFIQEQTTIPLGQSLTYSVQVIKDSVVIEGMELLWQSSNEEVATVTNGTVTTHQLGNATIKVSLMDFPLVQAIKEIEVIEDQTEVITYQFWSANTDGSNKSYSTFSVENGKEKMFGVEKYSNGEIASTNDAYTFELDPNGTPSSAYTYMVLTNETVKIKADGSGYHLILTATSNETGETISVMIELKSSGGWW